MNRTSALADGGDHNRLITGFLDFVDGHALRETVTAFDRRRIPSQPSAPCAFENLIGEHPTDDDDATVAWAASAEMYLRLGVFGSPS
jgi:hypothetical protein